MQYELIEVTCPLDLGESIFTDLTPGYSFELSTPPNRASRALFVVESPVGFRGKDKHFPVYSIIYKGDIKKTLIDIGHTPQEASDKAYGHARAYIKKLPESERTPFIDKTSRAKPSKLEQSAQRQPSCTKVEDTHGGGADEPHFYEGE